MVEEQRVRDLFNEYKEKYSIPDNCRLLFQEDESMTEVYGTRKPWINICKRDRYDIDKTINALVHELVHVNTAQRLKKEVREWRDSQDFYNKKFIAFHILDEYVSYKEADEQLHVDLCSENFDKIHRSYEQKHFKMIYGALPYKTYLRNLDELLKFHFSGQDCFNKYGGFKENMRQFVNVLNAKADNVTTLTVEDLDQLYDSVTTALFYGETESLHEYNMYVEKILASAKAANT